MVWFEGKATVVEEVGRPPHVTELSLPVLLGCLGEAEAPPSVGRGTPIFGTLPKARDLYESLGTMRKLFLGLFSLAMVERAPCRAIQLTNGTKKCVYCKSQEWRPRI